MPSAQSDSVPRAAREFVTTHWSAVLAAGSPDSPCAVQALNQLCRTYWYPLYVWVRRQGYSPHDAEDLVQGFFARLLEKDDLADVDRARGKFRSFLLASLKHFMANERDRLNAWKRGGRHQFVPLQTEAAEIRYGVEPSPDTLSPDRIYDRRWALTVLDQVMVRLRAEFCLRGREALFDQLKTCLTGDRLDQPYQELARQLGMSENAVKVSVHRLRQRYRKLLREEVGQTVGHPTEIEVELRHLMQILCS